MDGHDLNDSDWERLDRFVRGVDDPDERSLLDAWVNADPDRRALAAAMRHAGRTSPAASNWPDANRALAKVRRELGLTRTPKRGTRHRRDGAR